jgi:uncharacterized protein
MLYYFFLFVAGIVGGFLAGLLGIGGGVIFIMVIPIALNYIGVPQEDLVQYTIANSIFAIFFSSLSSTYTLIRAKLFYRKEVLLLGVAAVISSTLILQFFVNTPAYSKNVFNIVVIAILFLILLKTLLTKQVKDNIPEQVREYKNINYSGAGFAAGAISSFTGLGGGVIIVPILHSVMKLNIKKANSISHGVICITSFFMTLTNLFESPSQSFEYYRVGYIIFPVALTLSLGVVIASPYGVAAAKKLPNRTLTYLFATFVIILMIRKLLEILL